MGSQTTLQYRTSVGVGGAQFGVVEDYEAVLARMREAAFKVNESAETIHWAQMIELTGNGPDGRPVRVALAPHAISYVTEIPEGDRQDVVE